MIIKKPYAFLIKNFKYVHAALGLLLAFISYRSLTILKFFNDYVKTGYYTYYEDLSSHFINFYLFIIIILIIVFNGALYLVMKIKDKKRLFYISASIFYFVLFVFMIYLFNLFRTIEIEVVDMRTIRMIRDILLMISLPQLFFTVFALMRSVGFDIKSFNFKKDLEELNITSDDDEEIEILVAKDNYKHMRKIRRFIRETKYFALEYKFFFIVIIFVIVSGLSLTLYLNIMVYNRKYKEMDQFISNSIKYNVEDSYITDVDYKGEEINENKSYVVISLNITNPSDKKKKLDTDNFKLVVNKEERFVTLSKGNYFIDFGQAYTNQNILPGSSKYYLIVFEIDRSEVSDSYEFRIFNDVDTFAGEINSKNKNVTIKPKRIKKIKIDDEYEINDVILFGESNLNKTSLTIKSFSVNKFFEEKFNYCVEEYCYEGIKGFMPNIIGVGPRMIIRLESSFEIDDSLYIKKHVSSTSDLIKYFGSIYYIDGESAKTSKINVLTSELINSNKVFIEVPAAAIKSDELKLFLTIRDRRYIIRLK